MKFGVVEYSSKSGEIWKHVPGRPNYLADPQKEIDPTSFGGYVTVLEGEHIPLTWLVKPTLWKKVFKRMFGYWPAMSSLSYMQKFDTILAVHQLSDAHEMVTFIKRLKQRYPNIFVLGVPTQPLGLLQVYLDKDIRAKSDFIEFMNACDVFLTVVKQTKQWYESMTATPIVYLPQIYPSSYASRSFLPRAKKEKVLFVAGITDRPDIPKGLLVAKLLQREFPQYMIDITEIPGVPTDLTNLKGSRYRVIPFRQWREHLPELAQKILVINTDYTLTRGRVQVDCAAVGTPSLGANSDGQLDLFPQLASTPETSVDALVTLGRTLLTDADHYNLVVRAAREKLRKYDYEESAARLKMLVKTFKSAA